MRALATGLAWGVLAAVATFAAAASIADAPQASDAADAKVVRRCVGGDGTISWQSAACDPGAREAAVRPIAIVGVAPAPVADGRAARSAPVRRGTAMHRPAVDPARARCAAARRAADARRERDWNRLGFRERSQLDADVARACAR